MPIKKNIRGPSAPWPEKRFAIVTGILCEENGITLTQADETNFVVAYGDQEWRLDVSVKDSGKRTSYLFVPKAQVQACPPLVPYLERLPRSSSRNIEMHRLVPLVGLGADFTLGEYVAAHHIDLNGGNNRLDNLVPIPAAQHDAIHREVIDRDPEAYIASLAEDRSGLALASDELREAVAAWRAVLEGHPHPEIVIPPDTVAPIEGEIERPEGSYNPVEEGLKDNSLGFHGNAMVVSATYLSFVPVVDKDGKPVLDDWDRPVLRDAWEPVIAVRGDGMGAIVTVDDDLPAYLTPAKRFDLAGQVLGYPRFDRGALASFAAGAPPRAGLAQRLSEAIGSRVTFEHRWYLAVVVAFIALTYAFTFLPRLVMLYLRSLGPGAGKSTLLELIAYLAFNAHPLKRGTPAALRTIASTARVTLLLDEMDTLNANGAGTAMIEFLCSRTDRGAVYTNMGPNETVRRYDVFGPTVIANVTSVVPVIASRCIEIPMAPRIGDHEEPVPMTGADWMALRHDLLNWAGENWRAIKHSCETDPAMNVGTNRFADLWRPLLAVAYHLDGEGMYQEVWEAAETTRLAARSADDLMDVMALGLSGAIQDRLQRVGGNGPVDMSLKFLLRSAHATLEPDRHSELPSKRMADFARSLHLPVEKMGKHGNSNGVVIENPATTLGLLRKRFPHLRDLITPIPTGP